MKIDSAIGAYIDGADRLAVELETLLSSIPAIAPEGGGQGEWDKALALDAWLKKQGLPACEWLPAPDGRVPGGKRPNLVLTLPGKSGRRLWVMSHLDVVPPGEPSLWQSDPYTVVERDGMVIGRGVEDNQQGIVSSVCAALAYLKTGTVPELTLKLLFVADEEVGSAHGIQFLLREHDLFKSDDLILIPDGGDAKGAQIEVAEKNLLWLKVQTIGKQCHGSTPDEGSNAFLAACDLALRLHDLERSFFTARDGLFAPNRSTISPTKKEANVPNINTIPGDDLFYFDCRILPRYPLDLVLEKFGEVKSTVEAEYGVSIKFELEQRVESRSTSPDAPIVTAIQSAVKSVYGVDARPVGIGGGTVGAYLRNAGFDCAVWSRLDERAHQPNEYAKLENILGDAKVIAGMLG
jgi:succinyl-diaminopimelate desuccinylase